MRMTATQSIREKIVGNVSKIPRDNIVGKQHTGSLEISAIAPRFWRSKNLPNSKDQIFSTIYLTILIGTGHRNAEGSSAAYPYIKTRPIQFLDPHQASFFKKLNRLFSIKYYYGASGPEIARNRTIQDTGTCPGLVLMPNAAGRGGRRAGIRQGTKQMQMRSANGITTCKMKSGELWDLHHIALHCI